MRFDLLFSRIVHRLRRFPQIGRKGKNAGSLSSIPSLQSVKICVICGQFWEDFLRPLSTFKTSRGVAWLVCLLLAVGIARAADPVGLAPLQEEIINRLYGPVERPADLEEFAARAVALKVPDQTIAEARLAFGIRTRTLDARLEETIRQLHRLREDHAWRKEDSRLFNTDTEAEGVLCFASALLADRAGNAPEYERCMKEAFWLNPGSGSILAGELRVHRDMADLLKLRVPMHKPLKNSVGDAKTMTDLIGSNNALLLVFWTSGNDLNASLLDTLTDYAAKLEPQKVIVVGINVQDLHGSAELERKKHNIKIPWLVDSIDRPMSKILRVVNTPTAVLVLPDGTVSYHGFPRSAALDSALKVLSVDLSAN